MSVDQILMSMREYARHRGVSAQAVSKAVARKRISVVYDAKGNRKIDPRVADIEWDRNSDESKFRSAGVDNRTPAEELDVPPASIPPSDKVGDAMRGSRAVRESYNAKLAKLEFEEKSGKLVGVSEVQREAFKLARAVRDSVMNLPDRLAPELAAETNIFKVHARLSEELRKCLESLQSSPIESEVGNSPE